MWARLTVERVERIQVSLTIQTWLRLLGMLTAASAVTPLGLLHLCPLQSWCNCLPIDPHLHKWVQSGHCSCTLKRRRALGAWSSCLCAVSGENKGQALSNQRLSHWIVETIKQAYEVADKSAPSDVICHSTRVSMRKMLLGEICVALSWTAPFTFSRFYCFNVALGSTLMSAIPPAASTS